MDKKLCFGLKRSPPTPIDHLVSICCDGKVQLPSSFNLKDKVKQVYDQLSINSCSANATANFFYHYPIMLIVALVDYTCTSVLDILIITELCLYKTMERH